MMQEINSIIQRRQQQLKGYFTETEWPKCEQEVMIQQSELVTKSHTANHAGKTPASFILGCGYARSKSNLNYITFLNN